jgi:hypothetical protein
MNGEVGVSSCLGLIFARCFDAGVDDTAKQLLHNSLLIIHYSFASEVWQKI